MQPGLKKASNSNSQDNLLIAAGFSPNQNKSELRCGMCRKTINTGHDPFEIIYVVEKSLKYGFLCGDCEKANNK